MDTDLRHNTLSLPTLTLGPQRPQQPSIPHTSSPPPTPPQAYNIFDGGDPDTMSGRAFVKIFRDRNMVQRNKGMTTQYLDLLFAKMKPKAQKRMGFRDFKAALEKIATEHKQASGDGVGMGGCV